MWIRKTSSSSSSMTISSGFDSRTNAVTIEDVRSEEHQQVSADVNQEITKSARPVMPMRSFVPTEEEKTRNRGGMYEQFTVASRRSAS